MPAERDLPGALTAAVLQWRARRIRDPLERLRYLSQAGARPRHAEWWLRRARIAPLFLLSILMPLLTVSDATAHRRTYPAPPRPAETSDPAAAVNVWQVERTPEHEIYSNGLRIENRFAVANEPRDYVLFERGRPEPRFWQRRSVPAGIVFHSTESQQAPFDPSHNHALKRIGTSLLVYLRSQHAYHFLIDRFGRVHRIVLETDAANHAGHSVWADQKWIYLNLNQSFLAIAFEAQMPQEQQTGPALPAQIHAARILTEMLRSKYNLPASNCVTHAQVSINPDNMQIGYHTDWGSGFPFRQIGLPDNYAQPLPGIWLFGLTYAPTFVKATGAPLWKSLALSEEQVRQAALGRGMGLGAYRQTLQQRYLQFMAALKRQSAPEERQDESN